MAADQIGQQQPVLEALEQLHVEVHDSHGVHVDLVEFGDITLEPLAVVVGAEVGQPGGLTCPPMHHFGV